MIFNRNKPGLGRDFNFLWGGQTVSRLGSEVTGLAVPLLAIDGLHATTFQVGVLTAMQTLPFLLVGLPSGALIDRSIRRNVLLMTDVGRAVVLSSVPIAWACGSLTYAQLLVVSLVVGCMTVFFDVAYQSYVPLLAKTDHLVRANGRLSATDEGARIAGPAVGGALVGAVGAAGAVVADVVSFVMSFFAVLSIKHRETKPERKVDSTGKPTTLRNEIAEGLNFVRHQPIIRSIACCTATGNFFWPMGMAVLVLFMRRELFYSPTKIGVIFAAGSVGGLVGATVASKVARRLGVGWTIILAATVFSWGALLYPLAYGKAGIIPLIAGFAIFAFGGVMYDVNQVSLRQALCPLELLGRMNASVRFVIWGAIPLGGFTGGVFGTWFGLRTTLWIAAIGGMFAVLWIVFSPVRQVKVIPTQRGAKTDPVGEAVSDIPVVEE